MKKSNPSPTLPDLLILCGWTPYSLHDHAPGCPAHTHHQRLLTIPFFYRFFLIFRLSAWSPPFLWQSTSREKGRVPGLETAAVVAVGLPSARDSVFFRWDFLIFRLVVPTSCRCFAEICVALQLMRCPMRLGQNHRQRGGEYPDKIQTAEKIKH